MATARLFRTLALLAILVPATGLVRSATAQVIRVGAFVSQPTGTVVPHNDSESAAPTIDIQRVRIDGVGGLDVHVRPGAVVRVQGERTADTATVAPGNRTAVPPHRPTAHVTIEFAGS